MHDFFNTLTPETWVGLGILVNQGLSMLRAHFSKKVISKNVQQIKDQVTPNGGGSMNDRIVKLGHSIDNILATQQAYFTVMMNNDDKAQARADHDGNWVFCNARLTEVFGIYHKEMLDKGWQVAVGRNVTERNEFIKAYTEYHRDRSPLNHEVYITNQDSRKASLYLVTAQDIIVEGKLQFHLIKFQNIE